MAFQWEMIHGVRICVTQGDKDGNEVPGRSVAGAALGDEAGVLPSDSFKRFCPCYELLTNSWTLRAKSE